MRKHVSWRVSVAVISMALMFGALLELGAYETGVRAEMRATARRELPPNYCTSCHSDAKTLKVIKYKEDR